MITPGRTRDSLPKRMFPDDEVDGLIAELADIEQRIERFSRRVQAANVRRPRSNQPGFYSSTLAQIGGLQGSWLARVKRMLSDDKWLMTIYPQVPPAQEKEQHNNVV